MDVGALTPPLWGFEEREKLMVFYERASGVRMHANYFRVGGVHQDLPAKLLDDIWAFCDPFLKVCDDLEGLLTGNRIFKQRNVGIAEVKLADAWGRARRCGPISGRTLAADVLIASTYLAGTNTRRVRRALAALFGGDGRQGHGEPDVAQGEERLWNAWNTRSLAEEPIVRLILDGTVVRVRLDRKATSISLLVVLGVRADGQKVLLAIKSMGGRFNTEQAYWWGSRRRRRWRWRWEMKQESSVHDQGDQRGHTGHPRNATSCPILPRAGV